MSNVTDNDILTYGSQGLIVPLEGYIEKYAPKLTAIFEKDPNLKKYVTAPDGHIYTAPKVQQLAHRVNPDNMFINKVWLDKLGLELPETTDDFYSVLKAFKEQDPNGNGKKDELPMSFIYPGDDSFDIYSFMGSFGVLDNGSNHVTAKNGVVQFSPVQDGYKEAVAYFHKLYSEGLIDPEVFTHDRKQMIAKGQEADELYGVFFAWFDENVIGNKRAEEDYVALPPLKGPRGDQMWNYKPSAVFSRNNFAVSEVNKYPEASIRWLDQCYDLSNSYELCAGMWDVNIKQVGDIVVYLDPPEGLSVDEFRYKNSPAYTVPYYLDAEAYGKMDLSSNHKRKIDRLENIYSKYFPPIEDIFPPAFFTVSQEEELSILRADINSYVSQKFASWVLGEFDVNSDWVSYKNQLNKMGLERYIEIHQEAYDSYYK
jgi:putative aldouronate transport system substrate-binding protein